MMFPHTIYSTSLSFPTRKYNEVRTDLRKKNKGRAGLQKVEGRTLWKKTKSYLGDVTTWTVKK